MRRTEERRRAGGGLFSLGRGLSPGGALADRGGAIERAGAIEQHVVRQIERSHENERGRGYLRGGSSLENSFRGGGSYPDGGSSPGGGYLPQHLPQQRHPQDGSFPRGVSYPGGCYLPQQPQDGSARSPHPRDEPLSVGGLFDLSELRARQERISREHSEQIAAYSVRGARRLSVARVDAPIQSTPFTRGSER